MGFVENVNTLAQNMTPEAIANTTVVASNIGSVNTVAGDITAVQVVAADLSEPVSEIETVASHIVNVDLVGGSIGNVNATGDNIANVNIVGTNIGWVGTVATSIVDVQEVADNTGSIAVVAADLALAYIDCSDDLGAISEPVCSTPSTGTSKIEVVANNIAAVNAIYANLAEILLADDNAAIVTALYDQFDDRFLGAKASDPLTDNDGNALLIGAMYYNSTTHVIRIWDSGWSDIIGITEASADTLTNKTVDDISNKVGANHVHYKVMNQSGSTINKGVLIKSVGYNVGEDAIRVAAVSSVSDVAIGIVSGNISDGAIGLVINTGVIDGVSTHVYPVNTVLYSNGSGGLTSVKPTTGYYQACAVVVRQQVNTGALLVEFTEPKLTINQIVSEITAIDCGTIS